MRIRHYDDLLAIDILAILFVLTVIFSPSNILRNILSLPFVLFFPGYTSIAMLFPRKSNLKNIERIVLSFPFSIVIATFIGFGLSFSPWRIHVYPIIISVTVFIIITSAIALYRRRYQER